MPTPTTSYGAASAIARWTDQGKWVGYVLVTSGEAGIDALPRHRPEVLISIHFGDRWPGGVNHADHRAVGVALIDAARDAANRWVFTGAGGDPWSGVRRPGKDPEPFLRGMAAAAGEQCGVPAAVIFELIAR